MGEIIASNFNFLDNSEHLIKLVESLSKQKLCKIFAYVPKC